MKSVVNAGCKVVVTGGKVGELYLHYANKFGLMVVRLPSKFDVRRLCKSIGATALPRIVSNIFLSVAYSVLNFVNYSSCKRYG